MEESKAARRRVEMTGGHSLPEPSLGEPVVELYKLAVEMADRVSARRAAANRFFFTVQAGLAVALGAFSISDDPHPDRFLLVLAAGAGALIAASWWLLLRSYRDLNAAKFAVITRIEVKHLPLQLFGDEWAELKRDPVKRWGSWYAEQGQVEQIVPLVYLALYCTVAIYVTMA